MASVTPEASYLAAILRMHMYPKAKHRSVCAFRRASVPKSVERMKEAQRTSGLIPCLEPDAEAQRLCSLRCTLTPAARAARSAYSRLDARRAIRSGTRYSRSQKHRRAAMGGFTQDDGYVRGVAADAQRFTGSLFDVLLPGRNSSYN